MNAEVVLAVLFLVGALVFVVGGFLYVTGLWAVTFRRGVEYRDAIKREKGSR